MCPVYKGMIQLAPILHSCLYAHDAICPSAISKSGGLLRDLSERPNTEIKLAIDSGVCEVPQTEQLYQEFADFN